MRLTAFYRVVVYLYYFACKVASRVKSDRLKAIVMCRVAVWEIVKAGRVVLVLVSWAVVLGLWIV